MYAHTFTYTRAGGWFQEVDNLKQKMEDPIFTGELEKPLEEMTIEERLMINEFNKFDEIDDEEENEDDEEDTQLVIESLIPQDPRERVRLCICLCVCLFMCLCMCV